MVQNDRGLKVLQWNIRGYFTNLASLQMLICRYDPDVILLQETKLRDVRPKNLGKYVIYHCSRNISSTRGGLAILVRSTIPHSELILNTSILANAINIQGRPDLAICNVYMEADRSIRKSDFNRLVGQLPDRVIIGGDFNAHSNCWGNSRTDARGRWIMQILWDKNLTILNDGSPTLVSSRGSMTAIDLSLVSPTLANRLEWELHWSTEGSDHFPIIISGGTTIARVNHMARYVESAANWRTFCNSVTSQVRSEIGRSGVNAEAANLKKILRVAAEASIPVSQGRGRVKPCWLSNDIQKAIMERNSILREHRRRPSGVSFRSLKEANARVKAMVREAKSQSWRTFSEGIDFHVDQNQAWARVRACAGRRKDRFIPMIKTAEDTIVTDAVEIAKEFNNEQVNFSSDDGLTLSHLRQKIKVLEDVYSTMYTPKLSITSTISCTELDRKLARLKGKTPGRDRISYEMIRKSGPEFRERLLQLYNRIIEEGVYPHAWRHANLAMIPKGGPGPIKTAADYRPISFLPCMSKLLEGILADRMKALIEGLLPDGIHGFRPGRGTQTLLLEMEDEMSNWLSQRDHGLVLSLDLKKAYEKVTIVTVVKQMKEWGFNPSSIKLVVNFMRNRTITTVVNGYQSTPLRVDNGLPQGSPLSPIIFVVYTNKLYESLSKCTNIQVFIYADNIFILARGEDAVESLRQARTVLNEWCHEVGAVIPEGSGEILHVCRKKLCIMENITETALGIVPAPHMKILGVYFSKTLRWNHHVKNVIERIAPILNMTKMLSARNANVPPEALRKIVRTLLGGTCSYGISLYGNAPTTTLSPLLKAINAVLRTSLGVLKSTPIPALKVEGGFDLQILAKELNISLVARNICNPRAPHYTKISRHLNVTNRPKKPSSIFLALETYLSCGGPSPDRVPMPDTLPLDPHLLLSCRVNIFPGMGKSDTPREIWLARYLEWRETHLTSRLIFTDASATEEKVAAAATSYHLDQHDDLFRTVLEGDTSASIAEMYAIWEVVRRIDGEGINTVVLTDSLGSINAIFNNSNRKYMPTYIRSVLLQNNGKISIGWVPGHVGIDGNERADKLAKRDEWGELPTVPPSETFCREVATKGLRSKEKSNWANLETFLGTHWLNPITPKLNPGLNKPQARILTRLRVGFARFNIEYRWTHEEPPQCIPCGERATSEHYLTECTITRSFFEGEIPPLKVLLDPSQEGDSPLFKLLNHLGIRHSI